jgi:putative ABC transport system permease protein
MKSFLEPLRTAWVSVITHKLRSFLTILGVVIGIAAVIVLMSVGKGVTARIVSSLTSLGTNLIFVQPGSTSSGGVGQGWGTASTLTLEDANAIADNVANINAVAPYSNSSAQVIAGSYNQRVQITGVTPSYQEVNNVALDEGDFFSQAEYDSRTKVAIIGATVASSLFPDQDPIGQKLRMSNTVFTVVGLMTSTGTGFTSNDNKMLIPLSTFQGLLSRGTNASGQHVVNSITVQASSKEAITIVKEDITALLQTRHKIAMDASNDFSVTTADDLISTITAATQSMTLLLGAIASISLLVGGIGVMNIMLVSVMERRREIGIRKALGAREKDIWGQFLIDSALLTFTGGIIGVIIGWGGSYLINRSGAVTTVVTSDVVILAVAVSVGIGLFFGFYPAWQAARLDPIQALRSE